jgi:hypothetical protein
MSNSRPNKPIAGQNGACYRGLSSWLLVACATPSCTIRSSWISERRPAGCRWQFKVPSYTPHHRGSACQSHVFMAFGLATSSEAPCGTTWPSRHPPCRSGACFHKRTSRAGASICCRKRGHVSTVSWQGLRGPSSPANKLGTEI